MYVLCMFVTVHKLKIASYCMCVHTCMNSNDKIHTVFCSIRTYVHMYNYCVHIFIADDYHSIHFKKNNDQVFKRAQELIHAGVCGMVHMLACTVSYYTYI